MSRKKTTKQKHAELKNLSTSVKASIFDMLVIADEILSDHAYVDANGGEDVLIDAMQDDEFAHFGKSPSLPEMLRAYRENRDRATWAEYKFNVRAMIDLATPEREAREVERVNWKSRALEAEAKVARLEVDLNRYRESDVEQSAKVERLTSELGELRGEIRAMQRMERVA